MTLTNLTSSNIFMICEPPILRSDYKFPLLAKPNSTFYGGLGFRPVFLAIVLRSLLDG